MKWRKASREAEPPAQPETGMTDEVAAGELDALRALEFEAGSSLDVVARLAAAALRERGEARKRVAELEEQLVRYTTAEFARGFTEGESKQAIIEVQAQEKFLAEMQKKYPQDICAELRTGKKHIKELEAQLAAHEARAKENREWACKYQSACQHLEHIASHWFLADSTRENMMRGAEAIRRLAGEEKTDA